MRSSLRCNELKPSLHQKEDGEGSVKSASCTATHTGHAPAVGEDNARNYVLVRRI